MTLFSPEQLVPTLKALYYATFVKHQDIVSEDCLFNVLSTVHGDQRSKDILTKVD